MKLEQNCFSLPPFSPFQKFRRLREGKEELDHYERGSFYNFTSGVAIRIDAWWGQATTTRPKLTQRKKVYQKSPGCLAST